MSQNTQDSGDYLINVGKGRVCLIFRYDQSRLTFLPPRGVTSLYTLSHAKRSKAGESEKKCWMNLEGTFTINVLE